MNVYKVKNAASTALQILLGEKTVRHVYFKKSKHAYTKAGIVFVHIPKAAGSSITKPIFGGRVGHFTAKEILEKDTNGRLSSLPWFTVTRDPIERLISSYNFAKAGVGSTGAVKYNSEYRTDDFTTFKAFLHGWLSKKNVLELDRIFWPQSAFFEFKGEKPEIFVGKTSDLESVSEYLVSKGIETGAFQRLNETKRKEGVIVDKEDIDLIKRIYVADRALFDC